MALNSDACGVIDPSIPQWKRELILRRRALGRTLQVGSGSVKLTCPAVVAVVRQPESFVGCENITANTQKCSPSAEDSSFSSLNQNRVDFHPGPSSAGSVSNMRLLDACSEVDNLVINNGLDVKNKQSGVVTNNSETSVNYSLIMGEDKSLNLKKKSAPRPKQEKNNCSITTRQRFFIEKVSNEGTNGKSSKDEDCLSDSSEELQYGPGIVNKLKTKYLSMTLREQKRHIRPSLSNLRRATSLENMLEGDNLNEQTKMITEVKVKTENVSLSDRTTLIGKSTGLSSNRGIRTLGNTRLETMKRAQSMDTLLKSEVRATLKPIVNENIIIVEKENLGTNPPSEPSTRLRRDVNAELPPPDLVKQTLKIFETSPKRKVKPAGQNNLAKLVAGFSTPASQPVSSLSSRSIDRRKVNQNNKPTLSPKPILSPEKLRRTKMGSPKRNQPLASSVQTANRILSSSNSSRPVGINNERGKPLRVSSEQSVSEKKTVTSPKVLSPRSVSPIVTVLTNNDHPSLAPQPSDKSHCQNSIANGEKEIPSVHSDELEEIDGHCESSKPVPETALENIRRGGVSMQFSFNSESSQSLTNKSYLPRPKSPTQALNTSLLKEQLDKSPPPTSFVTPRQQGSPQTKQVGIIRPLVSTKTQSSVSSTPALTEQEIEKNLINRVRSIEQPISKVLVAIKTLPDNVVLGSVSADMVTNKSVALSQGCASSKVKNQGLWDEKIWHSNQNTIVFNFSNRKEVPDYIENDGLILRGKRDRPRPGDGGFILLEGGTGDADETSTEAEDLLTSAPPSPCDVTFVGDNVLINGKSNLKKTPKQVKLRIQFNDEATTMFEYPSEASLVEEEVLETVASGRERDESDAAQASPSASASGAPGLSMNLGIPPPEFLPPPVPSRPLPPPPVGQCPSIPLVIKARAPQPPAHSLAPAGPPVPPRSPPRLYKSNSLDVVSSSSRKPISHTNMSSAKCSKDKYFSMKKIRSSSKPTSDLTFDAKGQPVQSDATESVLVSTDKSINLAENQLCTKIPRLVEKVTQQPQFEVAPVDNTITIEPSNISDTKTISFIKPDENYNCLNLVNTKTGQSQSAHLPLENTSSNHSEVIKLENCNVLNDIGSDAHSKKMENMLVSGKESHQSPKKYSGNVCTFSTIQKNAGGNANERTAISKLLSEKSDDKELSGGVNKIKALPTRPVVDLKNKPKPVKIVQPFMGTKSLPITLLGSPNLDGTPLYRPVYCKPSYKCPNQNSELTVDSVLSQVLTQKKIPSPTFVNRSLSTRQVLVLEDWPLGGSLGAYTPRQVAAGDWQLGVTPVLPPPAPHTASATDKAEEDHFKPAPPEATVAWSEDTASDLLF